MKKKLLMVLKMAAFLSFKGLLCEIVLFNILLASAPTVAQNLKDLKINVSLNNVTVEKVLQVIEEETNFRFNYVKGDLPREETICIGPGSGSLYDILAGIAKEYSLVFKRVNEQITVLKEDGEAVNVITAVEYGIVKGYVTDGDTKEALQGVTIKINGTTIGTFTDKRGYYEINNLKPGKYTVVASYVGYSANAKEITISSGKTVEINFSLSQGVVSLDEVTVTGSISERSLKESANPITVITPVDLENRNINSLGSILQMVPGVLSSVSSSQIMNGGLGKAGDMSLSQLNIRGFSPSGQLSNNTKFLIDGVEIFDSYSLSSIDLNEIEKIEVSRGPMSSTLYGAGSSGGIVQIFTKKGNGTLKVDFRTMFTSQESKYQEANPINQQFSLNLSGGKTDFGYRTSLTYSHYPISRYQINNGLDEKDWDISSSMYGNISNVKAELSLRYGTSTGGSFADNIWYTIAKNENWIYANFLKATNLITDQETKTKSYNIGLTLKQPITDNLYHNLTVGNSESMITSHFNTNSSLGADPQYKESSTTNTMVTFKYFLNLNQPISSDFKADITAGIDLNQGQYNQIYGYYTIPFSENNTQYTSLLISGFHEMETSTTTGLFAESVFGLWEKLFLTTGLRAEKNSSYGDALGWYYTPRIGLTYVAALGDFTFKPRVSWGKSTQSVPPSYKAARSSTSGNNTFYYLGNDNLRPQNQKGYELGLDVLFTNNFSIGITYYNQKVTDYVQQVFLSDISDTYNSYYQFQNVSVVYNKGLELSAKAIVKPFTLDISWTLSDSRYGPGFTYSTSTIYITEGARPLNVPTGTLFAKLSYHVPSLSPLTKKGGNLSLEYTWTGSEVNWDYYTMMKNMYNYFHYINNYKDFNSFSLWNLRSDLSVLDNLNLFIDIANLLNKQELNGGVMPEKGRSINFGLNMSIL
jgi:outer membrane receptor for ferrienterochelin and colicin